MNITLRPYQDEAVKTFASSVRKGERKLLAVMFVGAGKTSLFSYITGLVVKQKKKVLIIAHREELLQQAKERVELMNPGVVVGIEGGDRHINGTEQVVVASIATIGRTLSERIKKFDVREYGLVIIDEVHHITGGTYKNVLEYFGIVKGNSNHPVLLGVTATPNRMDGQDLGEIFDTVIGNYDIRYGINNGYLTQIKAYTVGTETDISTVGVTAGDFKIGELSDAVNNSERNNLIVQTYKKLLDHEKAIVFCVNVEHSKSVAEFFKKAGYKADSVTGDTPDDERKRILDSYKNGDLEVLVNVSVLTEGYDAPNTMGVLMARPTKSEGLYVQIVGRCLRLAENKEFAKIIDFVDNTKNNSIITSSSLIGLKKPIKIFGESLFDYDEKFKQLLANNPFVDVSTVDLADIDQKIHEINIMDCIKVPEDVQRLSKYGWHLYGTGYKISLGEHIEMKRINGTDIEIENKVRTLATVQENALGKYTIEFIYMYADIPTFQNGFSRWRRVVGITDNAPTKELALKKADGIIQSSFRDRVGLIDQNANWKKGEPSEKQVTLLKKFGYATPEKLTKGEAGNLLTYYFDKKEEEKKKKEQEQKNKPKDEKPKKKVKIKRKVGK